MRNAGTSWMRTMDTRLLATVQAVAGSRCHESASLLQQYYNAAYTCARLLGIVDFEAARTELHDVEAALRRFVSECRQPELARARRMVAIA